MTLETTETQSQNKSYWVSFRPLDGKILKISKRKPADSSKALSFLSSSEILESLVRSKVNINDYMVHTNMFTNEYVVDKKKDELELQPISNKLERITSDKDIEQCEIYIFVYKKDNKAVINVNKEKLRKSANLAKINGIVLNEYNLMNVFICKENNPDYLLDTLEVDAYSLIKNGKVVVSIPESVVFNDVSFFTIPLFENYTIHYYDKDFSTSSENHKKRYIHSNFVHKLSNINIYTVNENELCLTTNDTSLDVFNHNENFKMLVCDNEYDKFIGGIDISVNELISKKKLFVSLPFSITDNPLFLHKNSRVSISYNGDYKNDND